MQRETKDVIAHLEKWASKDALIAPDHFGCRYYDGCNASVGLALRGGDGCCMSYVGHQYGVGFRLAIVGMDHGKFNHQTFNERRQRILDRCVQEGFKRRHYAGVVKTAAAVLGKAGGYCRDNCAERCCANKDERCVLNRISQPNLVKCCGRAQGGRDSKSTPVMKRNCARHLSPELHLLRPNMVVFQGESKETRKVIGSEFARTGVDFQAIEECVDSHGPVLYYSTQFGAHFLFTHHPSRDQLKKQWPQVEIWLRYLRMHRLIPE